jgi:hypothetical protein
MADPNSRQRQDFLEATDTLSPTEATSESEDIEYEPTTHEEEEGSNQEEFIRRLLSGDEGDDGMEGDCVCSFVKDHN